MPVRDASFREYCFICDAVASTTCPRCKRALCKQHQPGGTNRCPSCEAEFYAEPGRLKNARSQSGLLAGFSIFFGIPAVAIALAAGAPIAALGIGGAALGFLGALGIRNIASGRRRQKFLAQGADEDRKLLGDGDDDDTSS